MIALGAQKELIEKIEQDSADKIANIVRRANKAVVGSTKTVEDEKVDIAQIGIDSVASLNNAASLLSNSLANDDANENEQRAKQAFEVDKKLKMATGAMTVTEGVMNAFSQTTDLTPTQTLRQINAGVAATIGLVNLAQIASTQYEGGGGAPTPQAEVAAPSFNLVQGTPEAANTNAILQGNTAPIKTYVVASDVVSQASLDRQIKESAGI